jgi:fatty-acyl-CoA synthase
MPIYGVDSYIADPSTLDELPPGETGEIVSSGPMLFKGYWKHPEADAAAFFERDGRRYFRTGDLGRVDEEGYFFIALPKSGSGKVMWRLLQDNER